MGAHGLGRDLLGLLLPVACAGCDRPDVPWCGACAASLAGPPRRCDAGAGRLDRLDGTTLPVWCVADFTGPVRAAVSAWKDQHRADLTPVLAAQLVRLVADPGLAGVVGAGPVLVVPAPSTAAAVRRRGQSPVLGLARALALAWRAAGVDAVAAPVLRRRGSGDLAGLSARGRAARVSGHLRVRRGTDLRGRRAVLVDDVLTSGATLAACERALQSAGALVLAGAVLAATPAPGSSVRDLARTAAGRTAGGGIPWGQPGGHAT